MKLKRRQKRDLRNILIAAALFLVLLLISHLLPELKWLHLILAVAAVAVVGWGVFRKAFVGIKNKQPFDENLLMAIAVLGALILGEYAEAVAALFP